MNPEATAHAAADEAPGARSGLERVATIGRNVAIAGLVVAFAGVVWGLATDSTRPLMSWLIGWAFWLSIGVGMLFLLMIWHVFHARWPAVVRRQVEHSLSALPWVALLFLPLLILPFLADDPGILWKWMNPAHELPGHGTVGEDPLYVSKSPYLNAGFFAFRAVVILGVFAALARYLRKWSFQLDRDGDAKHVDRSRMLSAAGIFLCAAGATFGAIDWFKSLEYHWFSTIYGVWFFAASMRAALSATLILCVILASKGYLKGILRQAHRYEFGSMMLAFTVFWAYISFSQYFLIYNANIPEETFWYNIREMNYDGSLNSWWWVGMGLVFGHFLLPFLALLWYKTKVAVKTSVFVAGWILVFHLLDLYYNIVPGKLDAPEMEGRGYLVRQFSVTPFDIAAIVGIGGLCVWLTCRSMGREEPIPVRDPNIRESLNYTE